MVAVVSLASCGSPPRAPEAPREVRAHATELCAPWGPSKLNRIELAPVDFAKTRDPELVRALARLGRNPATDPTHEPDDAPRAHRVTDDRFLLLVPFHTSEGWRPTRVRWSPQLWRAHIWERGSEDVPAELGHGYLDSPTPGGALFTGVLVNDPVPGIYDVSPDRTAPPLRRLAKLGEVTVIGSSAGWPVVWRQTQRGPSIACLGEQGPVGERALPMARDLAPPSVDAVRDQRVLLVHKDLARSTHATELCSESARFAITVLDLETGRMRVAGEALVSYVGAPTGMPRVFRSTHIAWSGPTSVDPFFEPLHSMAETYRETAVAHLDVRTEELALTTPRPPSTRCSFGLIRTDRF